MKRVRARSRINFRLFPIADQFTQRKVGRNVTFFVNPLPVVRCLPFVIDSHESEDSSWREWEQLKMPVCSSSAVHVVAEVKWIVSSRKGEQKCAREYASMPLTNFCLWMESIKQIGSCWMLFDEEKEAFMTGQTWFKNLHPGRCFETGQTILKLGYIVWPCFQVGS